MLSAIRSAGISRTAARAFSTSPARSADVAKLILVGRLGKNPELRTTKNDKEYVSYTVATTNYPGPPTNPDGSRGESTTTWHNVLSFNAGANGFLTKLTKGSQVYVEANFELREPEADAAPDTPQGQRQIFLRHETIRVLSSRASASHEEDSS